jgi:tyrosyl-tRNA synthetase
MLVGRELQQKMRKREKYVLTVPMLDGLDGKPMSKTSENTVNIGDSSHDMYGKIMSLRDELIPQYYELCTDITLEKGNARDQKARLAHEIVRIYHGSAKANTAEQEFVRVFRDKKQPADVPEVKIKKGITSLVDLLEQTKLVSSKSEARRLIKQKGVKIDGAVQEKDVQIQIKKGMRVQVGKRKFSKIG